MRGLRGIRVDVVIIVYQYAGHCITSTYQSATLHFASVLARPLSLSPLGRSQ